MFSQSESQTKSPSSSSTFKLVFGHILNPLSDEDCQYFPEGAMVLQSQILPETESSTSAADQTPVYVVADLGPREKILARWGAEKNICETLDFSQQLIIPAFFDMHFHWVQDDVREMPKDSLMHWLSAYTWPHEALFADPVYAEKRAREFFQKLIESGTLGGACYSSLHETALESAMKHVRGDFIIGNVLMTMNSPDYLCQTEEEALYLSDKFSKKYGSRYAFTPRFAPTTHPEVMEKGGQMAKQQGSFLQSHLSETPEEIDYVLGLYRQFPAFKNVKTYTEIYQQCGFLTPQTIMGHGIHLSEEECATLAQTKTSIAHCPTSNAPLAEGGLGSGLADFSLWEKHGIRWALGSDIGGGPFLSMLDVMRSFVQQQRQAGRSSATYIKALYRATAAGAEMLNLQKTHGQLSTGKMANFIVLPIAETESLSSSPSTSSPREKAEILLEKIIEGQVSHRKKYDSLVKSVIHQGQIIFQQ